MPSVSISADGNSAALTLTEKCAHKLSLRGTTLDDAIVLTIQYADIGDTNWRPLPVRDGEDPETLEKTFQDMIVAGGTQVRAVVSGYGTSDTVTLASTPLNEISVASVVAALTSHGVLKTGQVYNFENQVSSLVDSVEITTP